MPKNNSVTEDLDILKMIDDADHDVSLTTTKKKKPTCRDSYVTIDLDMVSEINNGINKTIAIQLNKKQYTILDMVTIYQRIFNADFKKARDQVYNDLNIIKYNKNMTVASMLRLCQLTGIQVDLVV